VPAHDPVDPQELLVLKTLSGHLEGLTPANGYDHDMAGRVFRGRSIFGAETDVPFLSILEHPNPDDGPEAGPEKAVRHDKWKLLLQGFVTDDKTNPLDPAYKLKAEVVLRLSEINAVKPQGGGPKFPIYRLANLVTDFHIGKGVVRPPTVNVSPTAFFYIPLTVGLKTNTLDPYGA
jgi:hypothetical protein